MGGLCEIRCRHHTQPRFVDAGVSVEQSSQRLDDLFAADVPFDRSPAAC